MKRILLCLTLVLFNSCGPEKTKSELNYIVNPYSHAKLKGLYEMPRLCIKGPYATAWRRQIVQGLMVWQRELRKRDPDIVSSAVISCDDYDYEIQTYATPGRAHANRRGRIRLFRNTDFATIVHEFGHAFAGLGDTYVEGVWTCKPGQPMSIMCSTRYGAKLFRDDINGLLKVYKDHATLEKPVMVFKKTISRLAQEKNCPRLTAYVRNYTSSLNYSNGRVSQAYGRAKIGQEDISMGFPYYMNATLVYQMYSSGLWEKIKKTRLFSSACK